jgi:hypothetical protein
MVKKIISFFLFSITISTCYGQTSPNTPSGYSVDLTSGNLIPFDSSLKTSGGWSSSSGSPAWVPNASPLGSFDPTNGYTFSYIKEELGVAGVSLSNLSHGYLNSNAVFVTGFSYGLKYSFPCANSIGTNCDGTSQNAAPANPVQDNLRVEIGYYPASGQNDFIVHQLGLKNMTDGNPAYNPNWQTLAVTYTFAGAKPLFQAGSVNMGIIGQDAGGWACLGSTCYGPQVKDAYIRANYSVDPCILNPAFNPNCPGFNNIIQNAQSPLFFNSYNIATSLPHIGGGVQLHGYEYGFNWYNYGSCYASFLFWCTDWRTDGGGNINFRVTDKNNNILISDKQYRQGNNTGGSYYNRVLFNESRNTLDMGSVQWWSDSVWNNFAFAGWTRPIWTPDPCYTQPLYSPNCSNFNAEIKRIASEVKAIQDAQLATTVASVTSTPTSNITTTVNNVTTTSPTVTVTTAENTELAKPTVTINSNSTQSTNSNLSGVTSKPMTTSNENTNFALNLVSKNQERESTIANQASKSAIEGANIAAISSLRQAENIAKDAAEKSSASADGSENANQIFANDTSRQNNMMGFGTQPANTSVVTAAIQQRTVNSTNTQTDNVSSSTSTVAIVQFNAMQVNNLGIQAFNPILPPNIQNQISSTSATLYQPPSQNASIDTKQNSFQQQERTLLSNDFVLAPNTQSVLEQQTRNFGMTTVMPVTQVDNPTVSSNFLTDRNNPINQIVEQRPTAFENTTQNTTTQTVKTNVQDNDAAGGVSINNIAITPVGFNAYSVALKDVAFYAPKEIYRNQKTVDNLRALRQLGSDRLHQEMVDQQYRK